MNRSSRRLILTAIPATAVPATQQKQLGIAQNRGRKTRKERRDERLARINETHATIAAVFPDPVPTAPEPAHRHECQKREPNAPPRHTTAPARHQWLDHRARWWRSYYKRTGIAGQPAEALPTSFAAELAMAYMKWLFGKEVFFETLGFALGLQPAEHASEPNSVWEAAVRRATYIYQGRPEVGINDPEHQSVLYEMWREPSCPISVTIKWALGLSAVRETFANLEIEIPDASASWVDFGEFWAGLQSLAAGTPADDAVPTSATA